jgi:hypothetical protein
MRISTLCLVVCAVTLCASSPTVRADDNPAQAAARAALEEQMRALDMQSASTNAPVPAPATPAQPVQPAVKAPAQPAVANPPAMETHQAAAPAATMQTTNPTNEPQAQPPPVAVTPSGATAPPTNPPAATAPAMTPTPRVVPAQTTAPAPAPAAPKASSSGNSLFGPVPPASGGAMSKGTTPSSTTSASPTAVQIPAPAPVQPLPMEPSQNNNSAAIPGKELGLQPIVAPPLPVSADQQAQLQALLEKYEAGGITPVQYQAERAKILNPPR